MTLRDAEKAQLAEANTWAAANGLQLIWGNGPSKDPHRQASLVWQFRPTGVDRLTSTTTLATGTTVASIYLPAGSGIGAAIALAESLQSLLSGRIYAGSVMLDEVTIMNQGRDGPSWRVDVMLPWEFDDVSIPRGATSLYETPGALVAYQTCRQVWEIDVRAPLALPTYWDNEPSPSVEPPFVVAKFRTLQPVPVEMSTIRVPGRILAGFHYALASGTEALDIAVDVACKAFDERTHRGVTFGTPIVNRVGRTSINTWQAIVRLPFHYDVRT